MIKRIILSIISISFFPIILSAQTQDLYIKSNPINPSPNQKVVLTIESNSTNLDSATITWSTNDKTIDSGIGKKSIEINAPDSGVTGVIRATVFGVNIAQTSASITLRPGSIDVIWESLDSYTPPFYKGKALPSSNSSIRLTAIPNQSAPNTMNYLWTKDSTVLGSLSGPGKNSITIKNSEFINRENISVSGSTNNFSGESSVSINIERPSLVFYQKRDGFVDYNNGFIDNFSMNNIGLILKIEPFFFSLNNKAVNDLVFEIKNGDNNITNFTIPSEISLSPISQVGVFPILVKIFHPEFIYQQVSKTLNIRPN